MLGQTLHLFIKALIIGLLVNIGLQHISAAPPIAVEHTILPDQVPLRSDLPVNNTEPHLSDQIDKTTP
jgi:hypothetical protein